MPVHRCAAPRDARVPHSPRCHVGGRAVRLRGPVRQMDRVGPGGDRARAHDGRGDRRWRSSCAIASARGGAPHWIAVPQWRDPRRALGRLLRGHQGVDGGDRAPRLRELSAVRAAARAHDARRAGHRARSSPAPRWCALGLVLLVPDFSWESHTVRGLAWGVLSGFTFALLTVRTRKLAPDRWSSEMALWQNAVAALCVLPVVVWQGGRGGPVDAPHALLDAAARHLLHGARAYAVHGEPRAAAGRRRRPCARRWSPSTGSRSL